MLTLAHPLHLYHRVESVVLPSWAQSQQLLGTSRNQLTALEYDPLRVETQTYCGTPHRNSEPPGTPKKNKPYLPKSVCYALSWATGRPQRAVPLHYLCQSCPAAQKALAARFWSFSASNMLLGLWETISWTATWAVQHPDNLPPMSHWDSSSSPVSRKCSQDLAKRCEHRHRSQHPSWTTMSTTQPQSQSKGQLILHGTLLGLERKSATMKSNETE